MSENSDLRERAREWQQWAKGKSYSDICNYSDPVGLCYELINALNAADSGGKGAVRENSKRSTSHCVHDAKFQGVCCLQLRVW